MKKYEEFVSVGLNSNTGRVIRVNYESGMIESDTYPIAKFMEEAESNLDLIPSPELVTVMGAKWGDVWKDIYDAVKKECP